MLVEVLKKMKHRLLDEH